MIKMCHHNGCICKGLSWVVDMTCAATSALAFASYAAHVAGPLPFESPPIPFLSSTFLPLFSLLQPGI